MRSRLAVFAVSAALACACSAPAQAQRSRVVVDSATRAALDEFILALRDMAAGRIVTPAAHIPVGGLLDSAGNISSIVGSPPEPTYTPDTQLTVFRSSVGAGARSRRSRAAGVSYLARRETGRRPRPTEFVIVEVEHTSGYRENVLFPYTTNEFGEPVFGDPIVERGTLQLFDPRRARAAR